jgi:asparagine synthase (glutamine-hydrolysing)
MCGICGAIDFEAPPGDEETILRMVESLAHRGPDDRGFEAKPPVLLGQTRLSIIDLSEAGHQPMASEDGATTLVYNGELYNFPELRVELEQAGHRFRSRSDTEVVLQAYQAWGEDAFARLNGMFALALWDARREVLLLARDRFGIKPLHVARRGGLLVFGSEIKALLAHGAVDPELSWDFLHEYLYYGNSLWEQTAFRDIERVLPGTFLRVSRRGVEEQRYWDIAALEAEPGDLEEYTAGVRERLDRAVRRHLVADVPVAVLLSGGVDSSAVAVLASRHTSGRLRTYTAGFEQGEDVDERPRARRLAAQLGTEHRELDVRAGDLLEVMEALVRAHDEPFADAANVPLYLLFREIRADGIKVVLQGDGGDEIFAGYRRYNVLSHAWFWRLVAGPAAAALGRWPATPTTQRGLRFLRAIGAADPALRMALLMTIEDTVTPPTRVLSEDARDRIRETDPFRAYRRAARFFGDRDELTRMLYTDCLLLLPDTYLAKVDRPTMAHSVEVRVPFLDAELTDYAIPIPSHTKVRRLQKKFLLRRALRGIVPDEILDGRKRGFTVPYGRWLRTGLRPALEGLLLDAGATYGPLLDRREVERCIREHTDGTRDNGYLLYKLLQLALWHRRYLGGPGS